MAYTPRGSAPGGPGTGRDLSTARGEGRPAPVIRTSAQGRPPGNGRSAGPAVTADGGVRLSPMPRRRDMPYLVLGIALVVFGALAAVLLVSRTSGRVSVLVLTRDVPVGQVVTAADLRVGQVLEGSGVPTVREADAAAVVGRVAAVPLRAGRLLAADDVGAPGWPPSGQVLVAVAVAPGAFPPELAPGMHVLAGTGSADGSAAAGAGTALLGNGLAGAPEAVVAAVRDNPAGTGGTVVSLLLTREGAGQVTAVPASSLRLVVVPAAAPAPAPVADPVADPALAPSPGTGGGG